MTNQEAADLRVLAERMQGRASFYTRMWREWAEVATPEVVLDLLDTINTLQRAIHDQAVAARR